MMIKQLTAAACLGLFAQTEAQAYNCTPPHANAYQGGGQASSHAAYYAQQRATKARKLAEMRKRARLAHAQAIAKQQARRAAALARQGGGLARPVANRHARAAVRPIQAAQATMQQRQAGGINYAGMTPEQQRIIMAMQLQQQRQAANLLSGMHQRSANMQLHSLNRFSAVQSCAIAGNCYVRDVRR